MHWTEYLPALFKGAQITAILALSSMAIGTILAFAAGIARFAGGPILSTIAVIYIEIFRGTSLLVQLFWLYYALPLIGISFDPITTGIMGLGLNIGAYGAEVVPEAQHEAARALNFSKGHTLFHVILPQAVVEMMPAFGNLAIHNLKDTALASLIAISDLTFQAQRLRNLTLDSVTIYTLTLFGYFAMALVLAAAIRWLERRLKRQTMAGGFA